MLGHLIGKQVCQQMTPGCSGKEQQQQLKPTADSCKQESIAGEEKCPSPSKTCINLSPLLSLGTDLRNKCHSTSQLHTGTEGKQSSCAHPAYL